MVTSASAGLPALNGTSTLQKVALLPLMIQGLDDCTATSQEVREQLFTEGRLVYIHVVPPHQCHGNTTAR